MKQAAPPVSVSQLTGRIRSVLETDFSDVTVEGEVTSFKTHSSGHRYFSLKDEGATLNCTMWKSRKLALTPQDGMKVIARGSVSVYPPRGSYQLDVRELQPLGEGELQLAFERLKRKLADEGLFAVERKRMLPAYPVRIGLVTSKTGAALHDIVSTIHRRNPLIEIVLRPALVQGDGAAQEIARAIAELNAAGGFDAMIVGRGGGSIEDLWAFNEEVVARAIYASAIPVISAVGHEIDFTIADLVADIRAATPTAAAELVSVPRADLIALLDSKCYLLSAAMRRRIESEQRRIQRIVGQRAMHLPQTIVHQHGQTLDATLRRLGIGASHLVAMRNATMEKSAARLQAVSPKRILSRGYAVVRSGNRVVTSAAAVTNDASIRIEWNDGERSAKITK